MIALNVAQLLKSLVGTTRAFEFDEHEPSLERSTGVRGPIRGQAKLVRTSRGILVSAQYQTSVELTCGRCLETFTSAASGSFEEEYLPTVDIHTGEFIEETGDEYRLGADHVLDLTEAIRQDILIRLPLQPLCRQTCEGLCPQCGAVRARETCACQPAEEASPFQVLARLLEPGRRDNRAE